MSPSAASLWYSRSSCLRWMANATRSNLAHHESSAPKTCSMIYFQAISRLATGARARKMVALPCTYEAGVAQPETITRLQQAEHRFGAATKMQYVVWTTSGSGQGSRRGAPPIARALSLPSASRKRGYQAWGVRFAWEWRRLPRQRRRPRPPLLRTPRPFLPGS